MPPKKRKGASDVTASSSKRRNTPRAHTKSEPRVTRGMAVHAARQAVFKTAELLEIICSFLPVQTLFRVKRVSKNFRNTINGSPTLQSKMFLRCVEQKQIWSLPHLSYLAFRLTVPQYTVAASNTVSGPVHHNSAWSEYHVGQSAIDGRINVLPARLNPLLQHSNNNELARTFAAAGHAARMIYNPCRLPADTRFLETRVTLSELVQTCRDYRIDAYLTNSPVTAVAVWISFYILDNRFRRFGGIFQGFISSRNGLKTNDLVNSTGKVIVRQKDWRYDDIKLPELPELLAEHNWDETRVDATAQMKVFLYGVVIPTEEEWEAVK